MAKMPWVFIKNSLFSLPLVFFFSKLFSILPPDNFPLLNLHPSFIEIYPKNKNFVFLRYTLDILILIHIVK